LNYWPVPKSIYSVLPKDGQPGSFWEDREDRHHAGIDLYAPPSSNVVAVESGTVVSVEEFTSPRILPYWNTTYSIMVKNPRGLFIRYAELEHVFVNNQDQVHAGQIIGEVGSVLIKDKIDHTSPHYIQKLKDADLPSMLHFEVYSTWPISGPRYLGGNFFTDEIPSGLIDPTTFLEPVMVTR
jgi:murein DD-endopeptidase MepM/ murein hydrolase activator NlpD